MLPELVKININKVLLQDQNENTKQSRNLPHNHPSYTTTSLLQPKLKNTDLLYYFEDHINTTTSLLQKGQSKARPMLQNWVIKGKIGLSSRDLLNE